jgi:hypothetical protein
LVLVIDPERLRIQRFFPQNFPDRGEKGKRTLIEIQEKNDFVSAHGAFVCENGRTSSYRKKWDVLKNKSPGISRKILFLVVYRLRRTKDER